MFPTLFGSEAFRNDTLALSNGSTITFEKKGTTILVTRVGINGRKAIVIHSEKSHRSELGEIVSRTYYNKDGIEIPTSRSSASSPYSFVTEKSSK